MELYKKYFAVCGGKNFILIDTLFSLFREAK